MVKQDYIDKLISIQSFSVSELLFGQQVAPVPGRRTGPDYDDIRLIRLGRKNIQIPRIQSTFRLLIPRQPAGKPSCLVTLD